MSSRSMLKSLAGERASLARDGICRCQNVNHPVGWRNINIGIVWPRNKYQGHWIHFYNGHPYVSERIQPIDLLGFRGEARETNVIFNSHPGRYDVTYTVVYGCDGFIGNILSTPPGRYDATCNILYGCDGFIDKYTINSCEEIWCKIQNCIWLRWLHRQYSINSSTSKQNIMPISSVDRRLWV